MVSLKGILDITNLLVILFLITSVLETWVIISNNYSSLICIISLILFVNIFLLIYFKTSPTKIENVIVIHNKFYILNFIVQFYSGLLMLGLSVLNIVLGIICIFISLANLCYVVFDIDFQNTNHTRTKYTTTSYHPNIFNPLQNSYKPETTSSEHSDDTEINPNDNINKNIVTID
tara:strand:+ start:963 stop:1487 length:525 start_codon:yes stop_codon:yes gene_type:complete